MYLLCYERTWQRTGTLLDSATGSAMLHHVTIHDSLADTLFQGTQVSITGSTIGRVLCLTVNPVRPFPQTVLHLFLGTVGTGRLLGWNDCIVDALRVVRCGHGTVGKARVERVHSLVQGGRSLRGLRVAHLALLLERGILRRQLGVAVVAPRQDSGAKAVPLSLQRRVLKVLYHGFCSSV